jgi:hypothetical protein
MFSPKRLLRSPRTIVAELALLALAGLASTAVTQAPTPAERGRLALEHPLAAAAVRLLASCSSRPPTTRAWSRPPASGCR